MAFIPITFEDYFGDKPKNYEQDYTVQIVENACELLRRVNALLERLDDVYFKYQGINSGWRPKTYNDRVPNASKTSKHITAQAVDLSDPRQELSLLLDAHQGDLLVHYDLYMEHQSATPTWCHLQTVAPGSGRRVFRP